MSKMTKVTAVYDELAEMAGDELNDRQKLELAAHLVEMTDPDFISMAANEPEYGGTPFNLWSLDAAFADGGWRVLSRADALEQALDDQERLDLRTHEGLLRFQREYVA